MKSSKNNCSVCSVEIIDFKEEKLPCKNCHFSHNQFIEMVSSVAEADMLYVPQTET